MARDTMGGVPSVVVPTSDGAVRLVDFPGGERRVSSGDLAAAIHEVERGPTPPRWVWVDTNAHYPALLRSGVRVDRAHDLRLAHRIVRHSTRTAESALATAPPGPWDDMTAVPVGGADRETAEPVLFEDPMSTRQPSSTLDPVAEFAAQTDAVEGSTTPARLRLLLAAESAGALVAAEMHHAGMPWRADVHEAILADILGPRPRHGERPERLEVLADQIRAALDATQTLNPDSHPDLLKAMEYAGVGAKSLRKWELERLDHPVIAPLLEYKSLSRLLTANGWTWVDTWVRGGRFRTEYVVGGVVTGRWASSGGGALQLPKSVRAAAIADPGWTFVVADAAQLEPRVLAGMARDEAMAAAGRGPGGHGADMYTGIVDTGAVESRELAKLGMLGAMYGGTTGASGQVLPRLARAFPRAVALVDEAAQTGERGEVVTTYLGRSSPPPGAAWQETQSGAYDDADTGAVARARSYTRSWGRFTRNFVVQGTAAEWAMCWLASIRQRLWVLGESGEVDGSRDSKVPAPFEARPHLVSFLHDEVVVHTPVELADAVAAEVRSAADEAGRLLFGDFPVAFPLSVTVVDCYADAA